MLPILTSQQPPEPSPSNPKREDPGRPPRSALRWSLWGAHAGWGAFGAPTGARVHVMGMSHAEWGPRGLRRDWTLYDETAVWTQILLHAGEA